MSKLTTNRYTKYRDGLLLALPVAAGAHIFKGSLVCMHFGHAVPGEDLPERNFAGIALEEVDNTSGGNGALSVRVQTAGVFSLAKQGEIKSADYGKPIYITDDQTVGLDSEHGVRCGRLEGLDGADVWVRIQLV